MEKSKEVLEVANKENIKDCDIEFPDVEELENKSKEELVGMVMRMETTLEMTFSGPLPHPKILEGYEKILPGSAERIFAMAEKQSDHRQDLEKEVVKSNTIDSKLGIGSAFVIGLTGVIGGIIVILNGAALAGTFITGGSLAAIVTSFVYGTRSERAERVEKSKEME